MRGEQLRSADKKGAIVLCKTCVKNTFSRVIMISCQSTVIIIIDPLWQKNSSIKSPGNNSMITWVLQWAWHGRPNSAVGGLQQCCRLQPAGSSLHAMRCENSQNCDKDDSQQPHSAVAGGGFLENSLWSLTLRVWELREMRERETREIVIIESQVWAVMERPGGDKDNKTEYFRLRLSA